MNVRPKRLAFTITLTVVLSSPVAADPPEHPPEFADGLAGGPDYWAVTGVPDNDVLNVRSGPGTSHDVSGTLANGDMARNLGCRMHREQRWCRIRTLGDEPIEGWVNGRYLEETAPPGAAGRRVIHSTDDGPDVVVRASGEYEVSFRAGCVALYGGNGKKITAGATCSAKQLLRAREAVDKLRTE